MLHTDGGGEYTSSAFKAACLARGIRQKFTNVETPEENHLAEKANEFVFKIRTYLTISGLPSTLWGYCFDYVVFVYNNTPQELLNQRTPFEALFSKPSRLVRVAGADVSSGSTNPTDLRSSADVIPEIALD
ncbi:hypothetical protein DYB37_009270 [Aphanomyces astaci]|uniref:Integrase catalytic domain-containing protein n=1 Tax=Aphanomyces astaci TaxID=112090 RepID=A0A418ESN4_APHAT|nr:hypothetical protein DYB37_009270 [Aphanomyces astaci]